MGRPRTLVMLLGAAAAFAAGMAAVRHRGTAMGQRVQGGILIGNGAAYDALSRRLLTSLHGPIAADAAAVARDGARVLEVGCGPGHMSIRLARLHGLEVIGLDLDPAMIERARANAARAVDSHGRSLSFIAGDVASLPFPGGSFDLVVSTLSMHHWSDAPAALAEIGRVLRTDGRALIWDLRPGLPRHGQLPHPVAYTRGSPLHVVSVTPWRWPWRLKLTQRLELVRAGGTLTHAATS